MVLPELADGIAGPGSVGRGLGRSHDFIADRLTQGQRILQAGVVATGVEDAGESKKGLADLKLGLGGRANPIPETASNSSQTDNGKNLDLRIPPKCTGNKSLGQKNSEGQTLFGGQTAN